MITHKLISACWLIFILYWAVSALRTKKTVWRQGFTGESLYRIPTISGALLLFWPRLSAGWDFRIIPAAISLHILASILSVFGLACAIWARRTLASNWSGNVTLKADHELVERGPYQFVRHPIYTGMFMMLLATVISSGRLSSLIGLFIIVLGFVIKLKQEETLMLKTFPSEYPAYRVRTKAIIPYVL